ncbi:unnamed protein product [Heligmosomoides polygyrus]|uniref:Protein kinase domain-containing protein n=1 Tax=Heligmosomoides polygyrus TaxID=6339 RepID=A0A183GFB8_HELPZ|nr:unnamed protein product [Heligmosomoides polygyrus]
MPADARVVIHLLTLKCGPPIDKEPSREEIKLAERMASILKDFETSQIDVYEDEQLEVPPEQSDKLGSFLPTRCFHKKGILRREPLSPYLIGSQLGRINISSHAPAPAERRRIEPTTLIEAQDIWPFRDATYDNFNQVLKRQRTLNEHVNEGNTEIAQRLNETFQTMGQQAAADRLLHPAQPIVEVHALDHGHSPRRPEFDQAYQPRRPEFDHAYQRPEQPTAQRSSGSQEEECRFVYVAKMKGLRMGHVWTNESNEFALSWSTGLQTVQDCLKQLVVTDQGYAVSFLRRTPRSVAPEVGLVTSNQLSAQLLAVEGSVQTALAATFQHAISALRERTNILAISLYASLRSNPTLTMRNLLERQDVDETHSGNGFVQIRRCIPLPMAAIRLLPFNSSCFEYPRVKLSLPSGSKWQVFLNPETGVVISTAPTADCASTSPFYLLANRSLIRFSALDGKVTPVSMQGIETISSLPQFASVTVAPKLTIFHNLILTNFSEVTADNQLQEMWIAADHERLIDHITHMETPRTRTDTALSQIVFFSIITHVAVPEPPTEDTPLRTISRPRFAAPLALSQVKIDTENGWPPRATSVPAQVMALPTGQQFFITQIPVSANHVRMLALVDTCAGITVASQSLLPLLGIFRLDPSHVPSAVGMAGIPVRFVGCATIDMEIGDQQLKQTVHFTESQCVPTAAKSYNMILGKRRPKPPSSLIFAFVVEELPLPIPPTPEPPLEIAVRAAETVILQPGSEAWFRAMWPTSPGISGQ